jgi:hypothetical protein
MRRTGIVALAAVWIAVGVCAEVLGTGQVTDPLVLEPTPEKINVVHNWDELAQQPAIMLDGDEAHLGLEATEAPARSGILVYCRMERVTGRTVSWKDEGEGLGPLSMQVVAKSRKLVRMLSQRQVSVADSEGPVLFVAAAFLDAPGEYDVEISSEGGIVARQRVKATAEAPPTWSALRPEAGAASRFTRAEGAVVPHWDGTLARKYPGGPGHVLPTYVPEKEDQTFEVEVTGNGLVFPQWPSAWLDVPNQLLVRFWVNGKAAAPAPVRKFGFVMKSGQLPAATGPVQVEVGVTAQELGADPGDKVEMQVLFSPDGYDNPSMRLMHVQRQATAEAGYARLSKRVTIVLPATTQPGDRSGVAPVAKKAAATEPD